MPLIQAAAGGEAAISSLAHTIQLAVAPVFLLSGVAAFLGVLTNRLARIIDRTRAIERSMSQGEAAAEPGGERELRTLRRRARMINRAIGMCTSCALLVASVVATLFIGAFLALDLSTLVAIAFIAAMLALIGGLLSFLQEVHLAIRHMRRSEV